MIERPNQRWVAWGAGNAHVELNVVQQERGVVSFVSFSQLQFDQGT
jgi:hypothetical protein